MPKKLFYILILIIVLPIAGCMKDTGPIHISVDITPGGEYVSAGTPTPTLSPTPTKEPTPEPTKEELFDYIEDLKIIEADEKYIYYSGWPFGGGMPFTVDGQLYNKGVGMYVSSKSITEKYKTDKFSWQLDKDYHRLIFDLGVEQQLQYGDSEKYGTFRIEVYIDDEPVWDSGAHDYQYTSINTEIEVPQGSKKLSIYLTESKGYNGTLNVALAGFELFYFE